MTTMKPICRLSDEPVQLVDDLLDDNTGQWNAELIRKMFIVPDAEAILNLPRLRTMEEDYWTWAWESWFLFCQVCIQSFKGEAMQYAEFAG